MLYERFFSTSENLNRYKYQLFTAHLYLFSVFKLPRQSVHRQSHINSAIFFLFLLFCRFWTVNNETIFDVRPNKNANNINRINWYFMYFMIICDRNGVFAQFRMPLVGEETPTNLNFYAKYNHKNWYFCYYLYKTDKFYPLSVSFNVPLNFLSSFI